MRAATFLLVATFNLALAQPVRVWLTTADQKSLLAPQPPVAFAAHAPAGVASIWIAENSQWQTVEGFGASMTDSAAYLLHQKVPAAALPAVMDSLFDHDRGIGVSFLRNPMGASDLTRFVYSYDDVAGGDPSLASFSIAHDQADILPLLRQAKAINPNLKMLGTPWSAPGWMKSTGSMVGGSLLPSAYGPFANYFVKYLQAYAAAGVNVDYITLQNEPLYLPNDYPGALMQAADQLQLLRDFVLPALTSAKLRTRVMVLDHNWDAPDYPVTVLKDGAVAQSPLVAGTAWHWYAGTPGMMTGVQQTLPNHGQWVTEASGGTWIQDQVRADFEAIIHSMRNWAKSFVKWSLALDANRGPHTGGCGTCSGLIEVDQPTGAVTNMIDYYTLGHFSKFVLPGAVRIWSSNAPGVITAAFLNPNRSRVLVAYNTSTSDRAVAIRWNGRALSYTLPAGSGATFVWNAGPKQDCSSAVVASAALRRQPACEPPVASALERMPASSYMEISGLATEPTNDADGGFDLGYAKEGSWAHYADLDFGSGVSTLNARVACGSSPGVLEFRLDRADGPLIAQVTVPVTGDWQNWVTQTVPVSGAAGQHALYVVFRGAAQGIANLNWIQFQ